MAIRTPIRLGAAVGVLLAVVAAGVAAMVLFAAGKASEVDLTTAEFVPADAGLYVAFNTDLSSAPWVNAFKLARRLGEENPEGSLRDAVAEGNLDWDEDVAPFLGGNAAVYVRSVDVAFLDVKGGVVLKCRDCAGAVRVLRRESGLDFEASAHDGVEYLDGGLLFVATARGHLFIAMDEASLFEMLDLAKGKGASLASTADFKHLRDEVSKDFLAFVYASAERLAVAGLFDDAVFRSALEDAGVGDVAFKPVAMAIAARGGGFQVQSASVGDAGTSSPLLAAHTSRFASMVPPETALFFQATNIASAWEAALKGGQSQIDEAIRESTPYQDLDELMAAAGSEVGIGSITDLFAQLGGETAVAIWFPDGDQASAEGALLAEVQDAGEASRLLRALAQSAGGGQVTTRQVAGVEVTVFRNDDGDEAGYAFRGNDVVLGSLTGITAILELKGDSLATTSRFRATLDGLGAPTGTYGYFDLPKLLRLAEGGVVPQLDEVEQALGPAIINFVSDQGLVRMLAFVSVPE